MKARLLNAEYEKKEKLAWSVEPSAVMGHKIENAKLLNSNLQLN